MQLSIFQYESGKGWDRPLDASLDSENTLLLIFGPSDIGALSEGMEALRRAYARSVWMGCSTAGEISGHVVRDRTLTVAVAKFTHGRLRAAVRKVDDAGGSFPAGAEIAASLMAGDLRGVFVLSDGLTVNGSELVRGLSSGLPKEVVVTGGLAGDGSRFQKTWVLQDGRMQSHCVAAVGFYGDGIGIAHGSRGGWDVLGPERGVTRARGNVLYALDGQPALELYKKYLGERAAELPASGLLFPLAIRNEREEDGLTVRTILAVDEAEQSITFAGDIPQGATVQLMRANFERLIDGAEQAAEQLALDGYAGGPLLAVAISCVGRRLVLGERIEEEVDAVLDALPEQTGLVGYYSYGELSPLASGRCDLHNQTMTLTAFWET